MLTVSPFAAPFEPPPAKPDAGGVGDGFAPLIAGLLGPDADLPVCTLLPPPGEALPDAPAAPSVEAVDAPPSILIATGSPAGPAAPTPTVDTPSPIGICKLAPPPRRFAPDCSLADAATTGGTIERADQVPWPTTPIRITLLTTTAAVPPADPRQSQPTPAPIDVPAIELPKERPQGRPKAAVPLAKPIAADRTVTFATLSHGETADDTADRERMDGLATMPASATPIVTPPVAFDISPKKPREPHPVFTVSGRNRPSPPNVAFEPGRLASAARAPRAAVPEEQPALPVPDATALTSTPLTGVRLASPTVHALPSGDSVEPAEHERAVSLEAVAATPARQSQTPAFAPAPPPVSATIVERPSLDPDPRAQPTPVAATKPAQAQTSAKQTPAIFDGGDGLPMVAARLVAPTQPLSIQPDRTAWASAIAPNPTPIAPVSGPVPLPAAETATPRRRQPDLEAIPPQADRADAPTARSAPERAAPVILPALQAFGAAIRRALADERKPVRQDTVADSFLTTIAPGATPAPAQPVIAASATLDTADRRWPHAMADQIERLRDAADSQSTRIRLLPDALGPVDVSVRRDGEQVHVQFSATQAETRQLLADAQPRLVDAAEARGLKLGRTDVSGGELPNDRGAADRQQQRAPAHAPQPDRPAPTRARATRVDDADTRIA